MRSDSARRPFTFGRAALLLAVVALASTAGSERRAWFVPAPVPDRVPPRPPNETACRYQEPQEFLMRSRYVPKAGISRAEQLARSRLHRKAIAYRTKRYGRYADYGRPQWNRHAPIESVAPTTFMGLRVRLHRKVHPALRCVEEQLKRVCASTPYQPQRLSGFRVQNSFWSNEVSNHVYGIALDIDPSKNPCCGCMARRRRGHPCRQPVASIFDRMAMPECWVHTFERFGFYWLGRDRLQDAMHFEFLGDPDSILRAGPGPDAAAGGS